MNRFQFLLSITTRPCTAGDKTLQSFVAWYRRLMGVKEQGAVQEVFRGYAGGTQGVFRGRVAWQRRHTGVNEEGV